MYWEVRKSKHTHKAYVEKWGKEKIKKTVKIKINENDIHNRDKNVKRLENLHH